MTLFALLIDRCGLFIEEAARFLGVRSDTAKSWSSGRREPSPEVIEELRSLYARQRRAAEEAIGKIEAMGDPPDAIELGLASDDAEAQSLGWPARGAHAAVLGMVAGRLKGRPVRIVPRGSTPATAAAADVHEPRS